MQTNNSKIRDRGQENHSSCRRCSHWQQGFALPTSGRHCGPLDSLEFVLDEGVHPKVPNQKEHGDEGVNAAVVQAQSVFLDQARAELILVAEWQDHLYCSVCLDSEVREGCIYKSKQRTAFGFEDGDGMNRI